MHKAYSEMKKLRITQVKSQIRRPKNQKLTLLTLGLRKMNQTVEHNATPSIIGMVNTIKHLVSVEEV